MKSMTAFSRREITQPWGSVSLEMRTVNHRYLDISLRLAEEIRFFEPRLRQMVADVLNRGRVDLTIKFAAGNDASAGINEEAVRQLLGYQDALRKMNAEVIALNTAQILEWPGVIETGAQDEAQVSEQLAGLLASALDEINEQRSVEGEKTKQILLQRVGSIRSIVTMVHEILPDANRLFRQSFEEKLAQMEVDVDSHRVEQELVVFLSKQDVAEELDRLLVHLEQVEMVLNSNKPIGRRLDFLMQELNRETNTMTSKSIDVRLNKASVEMKVLIEQMREQVQNIE